MEVNRRYGVIADMYSDDENDYIETNTYAEACQLANKLVKDREIKTAYVIIEYKIDEEEYCA